MPVITRVHLSSGSASGTSCVYTSLTHLPNPFPKARQDSNRGHSLGGTHIIKNRQPLLCSGLVTECRAKVTDQRGYDRPPPIRITTTSLRVRRSPQHLATPTRAPRAHEVPGYAPSGGCKGEQADGQSRAPPADPEHPQDKNHRPPATQVPT